MNKGRWLPAAVLLLGGTAAQAGGGLPSLVSRDLATTSGRIVGAPAMRATLAAPALSSLTGRASAGLTSAAASQALPGLELSSRSSSRSEDEHEHDGDGGGHENGHGNGNGRARGHENGHGRGNGSGSENETWIEYNTNQYPTELTAWTMDRAVRTQTGIGQIGAAVSSTPCSDCAGGDRAGAYATYAAGILDAGNSATGLVLKGPPPRPLLPSDLLAELTGQSFSWLDYNFHVWPDVLMEYTVDEYIGRTLTDGSSVMYATSLVLSYPEYATFYAPGVLAALGNGATGLVIKGPPPRPLLPSDPS